MNIKLITIPAFILMFCSCVGQKTTDVIIDRLDTVDFTELKNLSIFFRSEGDQKGSSRYFVSVFDKNCSPYIVDFDNAKKSIIQIKNNLVIETCGKDILTNEEIKRAVLKYVGYKVCLLFVDNEGDVYINPNRQEKPILLRKSLNSTPKDIEEYRQYRGNWYIRRE